MTSLTPHVETAFAHPMRVRYLEVDQQGIVFNMWYLGYVDDALDAYFTKLGFPVAALPEWGFDVHLAHAEIDWLAGLRHADEVEVLLSPAAIGGKSFTLDFAFRRAGEITSIGHVVYATVSTRDDSGTIPVPQVFRDALGEPAPLRER